MGRLTYQAPICDAIRAKQGKQGRTRSGRLINTAQLRWSRTGRRGWLAGGQRSVKFWRSCPPDLAVSDTEGCRSGLSRVAGCGLLIGREAVPYSQVLICHSGSAAACRRSARKGEIDNV